MRPRRRRAAAPAPPLELNTALMASTFRVDGEDGPVGTAFVLALAGRGPRAARHVLVTAGHVLDRVQRATATLVMRRQVAPRRWHRLLVPLRIRRRGRPLWVRHPRADVAALGLRLPRGVAASPVPASCLADDRALRALDVHPGDDLNTLGFPFGAASSRPGFPILRSGRIASYPLLPSRKHRVFLLDFRVFRGNSGGPVYLARAEAAGDGTPAPGGTVQLILGVVAREVMVTEQIQELYGRREQSYPLGLAEVVHASLVRETIARLLPAGRAARRSRPVAPARPVALPLQPRSETRRGPG